MQKTRDYSLLKNFFMNHLSHQKIGIIGGGAWGTALGEVYATHQNQTLLYTREVDLAQEINTFHHNSMYLKGFFLTPTLRASSSLNDFKECDILLLCPPAQALRTTIEDLLPILPIKNPPLIIASKGIEKDSGLLMSEIIEELTPKSPYAVLSGPSLAHEVVAHFPTALTLSCDHKDLCQHLQKVLSTPTLRLYRSYDPIGVQLSGALKNVIAIAAGIVIGAGLGENARAALITRGLIEMRALGKKYDALPETFSGLSGLGDLMLTAMSDRSRNTSFGIALGRQEDTDALLKERLSVTEGFHTAASVQILAKKFDLDLPICTAVFSILEKKISIQNAIKTLLSRPLKNEISEKD